MARSQSYTFYLVIIKQQKWSDFYFVLLKAKFVVNKCRTNKIIQAFFCFVCWFVFVVIVVVLRNLEYVKRLMNKTYGNNL